MFWKGHSLSPWLNDLALQLCKIEMGGQVQIQIVHVARTRMILQGSDGLSRGVMMEGAVTVQSILSFIPLNKSAAERQPEILLRQKSWIPSHHINLLIPETWFTEGHGTGPVTKDMFGV